MREGGPAFPDTFWLSPRALKSGGCSTADIRQAREAYIEELSAHRTATSLVTSLVTSALLVTS